MRLIVIALSMALLLGCSYQPFQSDALLDKIEQSKALDKEAEAELTNAITAFKKSFA